MFGVFCNSRQVEEAKEPCLNNCLVYQSVLDTSFVHVTNGIILISIFSLPY